MAENLKDQVAPKSPPGAPAHVQHLLSKLSESLNLDAPRTAFLALRENLIYLLELFAAVSAAAASESSSLDAKMKALWKREATLTDVENLLAGSLTALEAQRGNPAIANLRSVFFVGDTTSKPSPRRHSRLLRIAGAPFRGYVFLSEFAELKPASRDAFAAEVKRYLPILKEWLTAAAPFFKDLKVTEEGVTPEGTQQVMVELGTMKLDLGPAIRVQECSLCPAATLRAEAAKAAPAKPAAAAATATKSGVVKTAGVTTRTAAPAAKKPEDGAAPAPGATPVKSPVVKKVLIVKRPDGTIVRKVVQTVSASEVAKAKPAEGDAAKKTDAAPSPRPELVSPQEAPDKASAKVPVKSTVVKKVVQAVKKEGEPEPPKTSGAVSKAPEVFKPGVDSAPALEMARPTGLTSEDVGAKPAAEPAKTSAAVPKPAVEAAKTSAAVARPASEAARPAAEASPATETTKPEPEPAPAAKSEPESAPVAKPEPEPAPAAKPEPAPAPAAKTEPESAPAAKTEPETAPAAKTEPEPVPVAKTEPVPPARTEPEPAPAAKPEVAPAAAAQAEPEASPASVDTAKAEPPSATDSGATPRRAGVRPPSVNFGSGSIPVKPIEAPAPAKLEAPAAEAPPPEPETPVAAPEPAPVEVAAAEPPAPEEPVVVAEEAPVPEPAPEVVESPASEPSPAVEPAPEPPQPEPEAAEVSQEPPQPTPAKLAPEPEPLEIAQVETIEVAAGEPVSSPEPVSMTELPYEEELADELLLGAPEEGDIVLEEVVVSEDDLLLGAPEEFEEVMEAPGPAPAAVSLTSYAALTTPGGAPEHLKHLVDGFNSALKSNDLFAAATGVQATYEFLIRYYAGVTASLWQTASRKLPDNARSLMRNWASLGSCRELLAMSLPKLSGGDGITTTLLAAFKGSLADRVNRGPDIAAWCEKNLDGNQTAASEALATYLPEIRDFFKKAEEYFEGCEHFSEPPSSDGHLEVVVQFGEAFLELCQPDYVIQIRQCPVCLPKLSTKVSSAAAPPPAEEKVAPELSNLLFGGATEEEESPTALLGAASKPETLILKLGGPDPAPGGKSGIFAGLSKKLKVNAPAPMAALGIEVPENIPEHLGHILNRVSYGVAHQDAQETSLSVRDALEFLVRYFAGVAGLVARKLGKETPELKEAFSSEPMSVSRCEQVLFQALKATATSDDSLAVLLRQTFPTGSGDAHTKTITLDVENRLKALGKFCAQTQAGWDKVRCIRENSRFLPVLKDWLAASKAFFKGVETHAEAPADDGRMDVVVEHKEHFLELIPPEYTLLIRRCPVCLPTYRGNDPPVAEEDAPAPSAEVPRPGTVSPAPEAEAKGSGGVRRLDQAMDDLLAGKAAEKSAEAPAGEPAKPRPGLATPAADDEEPAMAHDVSYIGSGKAKEDGRIFHGGYINVVNVGGGTLSATVRPTHPCVTVKPVRFKGKHCRIEYQIDEADLPSSRKVYVVIRSANEERQIPIWQMLPPTSTLSMTDNALRFFMAIPAIVYMFVFLIVHTQACRLILGAMRTALGPEAPLDNATYLSSVKLAPGVVGAIGGIAQFDGAFFIFFSGLVPFLVAKIFAMAPPDQIHRNRKWFIGNLIAPLVIVTLIVLPLFKPVVIRPELKPMIFTGGMYLWFLAMNGLMAFYFYITRMNELEQWVQYAFMRKVIGVVVYCVYALCFMMAVFLE